MTEVRTQRQAVNGIELDVVEAGDPAAPAILLSHGFPECAYSWRHQMVPLAEAGYHVLAPDQRGYAGSSKPTEVTAYGVRHLTDDLAALLDVTGHDDAIVVGHDWGALVTWDMARLRPERMRGAICVSVPYTRWPAPPTELFKAASGGNFFYILYFQQVGPPEAELDHQVERAMRSILWAASGDAFSPEPPAPIPAAGNGFIDSMTARGEAPAELPAWLTEEDVATYVRAFEESGFFGPVSWYRNLDANYEVTKDLAAPSIPTAFIGGTHDAVIAYRPGYAAVMDAMLPDHRGTVMIGGAGHWTQQERPEEFNAALLRFIRDIDG